VDWNRSNQLKVNAFIAINAIKILPIPLLIILGESLQLTLTINNKFVVTCNLRNLYVYYPIIIK